MSEWKRHTFGELIDSGALLLSDGYRAKLEELGGDGPLFLRAGHVSDSHIDFTDVECFHAELEPRVRGKMSRPGDVVITTKGNSTGRVTYVSESLPPFVYSPHLSFWRSLKPNTIVAGFLRYWSHGEEFQQQLRALACATDMAPYLSLVDQKRLRITLPPLSEQRAIASVLGALDDKIELNRRMNETLEALARALFQNWFVDACLRRVRRGRQATQAGLPKGWRIATFASTVEILGGGTPKTSVPEYWGGNIPWFSVVDAPDHTDVFVVDTEKKITQAGIENSSTQILSDGTTIISARGTVGKIALVGVSMAMNQSCYGLRGKADKHGFFTYFATRALVSTLQQRAHGSVFDTITRDTLEGVEVAVPPSAVIESFESKVAPLLNRIRNNLLESRTLAALRDALLPKLLSGELRLPSQGFGTAGVPAAAKLVETGA